MVTFIIATLLFIIVTEVGMDAFIIIMVIMQTDALHGMAACVEIKVQEEVLFHLEGEEELMEMVITSIFQTEETTERTEVTHLVTAAQEIPDTIIQLEEIMERTKQQ